MPENDDFNGQIERLLNSAFENPGTDEILQLKGRFDEKLRELGISSFQVEKNLGIDYKTLNRLLEGDLKKFDLIPLMKLGYFLGIPEKEISDHFTNYLAKHHEEDLQQVKKSTFILSNFDLPVLKQLGVINSITNFTHIETRINQIFGLKSILDYDLGDAGAAYSATKVKPKNDKSRRYFKDKSKEIFRKINNPNRYDKQALIDYFPKIRWHSTSIESGFINVIKTLFDLGVTVIFQPKMPNLQLRGATFEVNGKPCIVLTDYRNAYPTFWFAFLHELFHVLFDWEEILIKRYHLSDEENDLYVLRHKEEEANDFAREYLFPKQKLEAVAERIKHPFYIKEFAFDNHVHPSIIYAYYAYLNNSEENNLWAQFDKFIRPPMEGLTQRLNGGLSHSSTAEEFANHFLNKIFNSNPNGEKNTKPAKF